jgi:hypothetical protein
MSNQSSQPSQKRQPTYVETITDPAEIAAADEWHRQYKKTAMGKIGCEQVVDAPIPLLAQVVAAFPAEDQAEFFKPLLDHLPIDALRKLHEDTQARLDRGAA